jgi:HAD superfamily hydrolase (TIGR01549 family)
VTNKLGINQPQAIIFDCWNTLFYIHSKRSWMSLWRRRSYPMVKRLERSFMLEPESSAVVVAAKLAKDLRLPPVGPVLSRIQRAVENPGQNYAAYHDAISVLADLRGRGYKLGMISNTFQLAFEPVRQQYHLDKIFDVITPSYEVGLLKPDRRIFQMMLEKLEVTADQAIMVGDSLRDDVLAAEDVGIKSILVDRHSHLDLHAPRIHNLSELLELL